MELAGAPCIDEAFVIALELQQSLLSPPLSVVMHSLHKTRDTYLSEEMYSLLRINRNNSVSWVAQLKIIVSHFRGSGINLQPFAAMDSSTLPLAIEYS